MGRRMGVFTATRRILAILAVVVLLTATHTVAYLAARLRGTDREFTTGWLLELLPALGPMFIKAGQLASMRQDVLPDYITTSLGRLWTDTGGCVEWDAEPVVRA